MQTFIPYSDFQKSLESLDKSRLQKQALETSQLIDAILNLPTKKGTVRKGWLNHPALIMWKHNVGSLFEYFLLNIEECKKRNIVTEYCESRVSLYSDFCQNVSRPVWWGDEIVHSSHRSRLLQKGWEQMLNANFNQTKVLNAIKTIEWYQSYSWDEMQDTNLMCVEYKWPVIQSSDVYSLKTNVSKQALKKKELLIQMYGHNPYI
jgi:hypothetical protein